MKIHKDVSVREKKLRQQRKIEELRCALTAEDATFRERAQTLGLSRSTAWAILQREYKNYGLTDSIVARLLASPNLPPKARMILLEYIREKSSGEYGHSVQSLKSASFSQNADDWKDSYLEAP